MKIDFDVKVIIISDYEDANAYLCCTSTYPINASPWCATRHDGS